MTLRDKLHPRRFPNMSPEMGAIVGCIVGRKYTVREINHLHITSDGFVLCGNRFLDKFLGTADALERNWADLLDTANVTPDERKVATEWYQTAITDWRGKIYG